MSSFKQTADALNSFNDWYASRTAIALAVLDGVDRATIASITVEPKKVGLIAIHPMVHIVFK